MFRSSNQLGLLLILLMCKETCTFTYAGPRFGSIEISTYISCLYSYLSYLCFQQNIDRSAASSHLNSCWPVSSKYGREDAHTQSGSTGSPEWPAPLFGQIMM